MVTMILKSANCFLWFVGLEKGGLGLTSTSGSHLFAVMNCSCYVLSRIEIKASEI